MRKLLIISLFLIMSTFSYAQDINKGGTIYVVEPGDTLWGIAQQFYQNPWMWPRIWDANTFIEDPGLIYPGKPLAIPKVINPPTAYNKGMTTSVKINNMNNAQQENNKPAQAQLSNNSQSSQSVVAENTEASPTEQPTSDQTNKNETISKQEKSNVSGEEEENIPSLTQKNNNVLSGNEVGEMPDEEQENTITTIVIPQPKPRKYFVRLGSEGFISKYSLSSYGKIISNNNIEKILFSQGDYLYINLGESDGIIPGDMFEDFEQIKPIKDKNSNEILGYLVRSKGLLKVTNVFKDTSKVEIMTSYDAIKVGDSIRPFEKFSKKIFRKPDTSNATGYIIALSDNRYSVGENDIIYINIGKHDGLKIGNTVDIFIKGKKIYDKSKDRYDSIPPFLIGKAIIIDVQEKTATALITNSVKEIYAGYGVRTTENQ